MISGALHAPGGSGDGALRGLLSVCLFVLVHSAGFSGTNSAPAAGRGCLQSLLASFLGESSSAYWPPAQMLVVAGRPTGLDTVSPAQLGWRERTDPKLRNG